MLDRRESLHWIVTGLLGLGLIATWSHAQAPSEALDRAHVTELAYRYARAVDRMDREALKETFASDAVAEYVGVGDNPYALDERLVGFEAIHGWLSKALGSGRNVTPWVFMSNPIVELQGDRAFVEVYMHNRPVGAVGVYRIEAARHESGWRIQHLRLEERTLPGNRPRTEVVE